MSAHRRHCCARCVSVCSSRTHFGFVESDALCQRVYSYEESFLLHMCVCACVYVCRIVRAFLVEEQKIVKKVLKLQAKKK